MPKYDFICRTCQKRSRLFFTYAEYGKKTAVCPHCQSTDLKRLIGRVALGKSSLESLADDAAIANLDGDDPKSVGRFMRKMSGEMGEAMGDDFNEVVDRLEKGQSPDKIEKDMPNLTNDTTAGE